MDSALELGSSELISLDDDQLDGVTGGCWHRRRHHGGRRRRGFGGGHGGSGGPDVDIDIDIDINVINFVGNSIAAGGDVTIVLDQDS